MKKDIKYSKFFLSFFFFYHIILFLGISGFSGSKMFPLTILVIIVSMQGIMCIPPTPYYDSYGPNQLFVQEGEDVITVSGAEFIQNVSAEKCAIICDWMSRQCQCCDSFAFKPSDETCYLKKRDSGLSNAVKYNKDGWQSYKYWDSVVGGYRGELPEVVEARSVGADVGYPYEVAYISMGKNRNAKKEGESIKTSLGVDFMSNSSPEQCADDCNAISDCDRFPLKHQQKDLRLALGLGEQTNTPLPVSAAANQLYLQAKAQGQADADFSAVLESIINQVENQQH
eukprot:TRINITY_DN7936_c0_g1_i3.p2 TRINITY_DN7936_c0_g1~~TRINITY_DN7936_c0_g1_i3.p2  ORF type:complete len:284 (-),score=25.77 TRINITY_DN7936_c0_g1_i3:324-1175(-)